MLFGDDCLRQLAAVPDEEASHGYEAELKLWWTYFARWAYAPDEPRDPIFMNSLCYKVAAECFRMDRGLRGEPVPDSRQRAIEAAFGEAAGDTAAYLTRLLQSALRRHLRYAGDIVEDSQSYVLALLEQAYGGLRCHPGWREIPGVSVCIDGPDEEQFYRTALPEAPGFRVSAVSAAAFAMDELVLLFEPVSENIPQARALQQLASVYIQLLAPGRSRVSLYLRLPNACYQFYVSDYYRGWQAILSPGFNPDLFRCGWTRPAAEFVYRERQLMAQALDDPVVYKANHLDFLRTFWKFLELAVLEATARRGEVVFAQTPEAVMRQLSQLSLPSVPFLENFATAYREEARGAPADIGRHIPAAVLYLKNIHHAI